MAKSVAARNAASSRRGAEKQTSRRRKTKERGGGKETPSRGTPPENRKKTPPYKCCVDTFTAPANVGPKQVTRPRAGIRRAGRTFNMLATFKNATLPSPEAQPCQCTCCEYRQYVKGFFKYDGRKLRHVLAGGQLMSETVWREDGMTRNGVDIHYGHRAENQRPGDEYLPDRPTGCRYRGWDYPGLGGSAGEEFEINLQFKGEIIDTCSGKVVQTKTWSFSMKGTLSRRSRYWR